MTGRLTQRVQSLGQETPRQCSLAAELGHQPLTSLQGSSSSPTVHRLQSQVHRETVSLSYGNQTSQKEGLSCSSPRGWSLLGGRTVRGPAEKAQWWPTHWGELRTVRVWRACPASLSTPCIWRQCWWQGHTGTDQVPRLGRRPGAGMGAGGSIGLHSGPETRLCIKPPHHPLPVSVSEPGCNPRQQSTHQT